MSQIQELGKKAKGAQKGNTYAKDAFDVDSALHHVLVNYEREDVERGQALKAIWKKAVEQAIDGDAKAREFVLERKGGKVASKVEAEFTLIAPWLEKIITDRN